MSLSLSYYLIIIIFLFIQSKNILIPICYIKNHSINTNISEKNRNISDKWQKTF